MKQYLLKNQKLNTSALNKLVNQRELTQKPSPKRFLNLLSKSLFILSFFLFTTCDDVIDCIVNVRPELHDKTLNIGEVDEYYSDIITADIKNEVNDNDYDYFFDVVGELPKGLEVSYSRYRKVVIKGTPKEAGRFNFEVFLDVVYIEPDNDRNGPLCTDNTSKSYTLAIRSKQ